MCIFNREIGINNSLLNVKESVKLMLVVKLTLILILYCTRAVHSGGGGQLPPEKTIFTIFRMTLLIILCVFGTFRHIGLTDPLVKKSCVNGPVLYQTNAQQEKN
jgi:hypothetical protein